MKEQTMMFNLSEPLEFSKGGEFETTYSLEIAPPSPRHYDLVMSLAKKVVRGVFDVQKVLPASAIERDPGDEARKPDADAIRGSLLLSTIPIKDYMDNFKNLLSHTCTLDGEAKMKADLFEKIGIEDRTNLLCEYVVNFIVPLAF